MPDTEPAELEIERLSRQLTMLERVSEMASIGGWRFDFATREVLWSAQTRRIHAVDAQFVPNESNIFQFYVPEKRDAYTRDIVRFNQSGQPYVMDIEILTADQRRIWTRVHGETQVVNGQAVSVWGTIQDITLQKNLELQLQASEARFRSLAFYDALTGLPNRRMLLDRLKLSVAASARHGQHGALLFIDLDKFKTLNDTLGHVMGDALLCQVAQRLQGCVRKIDTVARFGGDEFVVMLEELGLRADTAADMAAAVGAKILAAFSSPFLLEGPSGSSPYHTSPSIGVTVYNGQVSDLDALLQQADLAMYASKSAGRNTLRFYGAHGG
ncbi:MAG: hypothetical protein CFE43_20610 [Burkholderiales bacterium PBB3]|nr:MAG: hypothetical protein CFE43_20610 [Burkholderiales bacterium PBB3]